MKANTRKYRGGCLDIRKRGGHFTIEHNNTGKSPQKYYSCIDDGMDKLTEDKVK